MAIVHTTWSPTQSQGVVPVVDGEVTAECLSLQSREHRVNDSGHRVARLSTLPSTVLGGGITCFTQGWEDMQPAALFQGSMRRTERGLGRWRGWESRSLNWVLKGPRWVRLRSAGAQSLWPTWLGRALHPAVSLSWSLAGEDFCVTHVSPAWWLALLVAGFVPSLLLVPFELRATVFNIKRPPQVKGRLSDIWSLSGNWQHKHTTCPPSLAWGACCC